MNSQHQSGIIQLQEFLPNELLRMLNEYLYNPYEDIMNKVFEDIRNKPYVEKQINTNFEYVNFLVKQLHTLRKDKYYTGILYFYNLDENNNILSTPLYPHSIIITPTHRIFLSS